MSLNYNIIEIYTSEEARWKGKPVYLAIPEYLRKAKIATRCMASRGISGSYENGEIASGNIEVLSYNMPVKIEIIMPSSELEKVLPEIEEMVTDGLVSIKSLDVHYHKLTSQLIPRKLRVRDVMTSSTVSVTKTTPAGDIIKELLKSSFNAMPVVDAENRPVGIITQSDLILRAGMPVRLGLLSQFEKQRTEEYLKSISRKTAGEIMSPAVTVSQTKLLGEAVDLMLKNKLKRLPVVDNDGRLAGILARLDIFRTINAESPDWKSLKGKNVDIADMHYVKDVMQRETHTIFPETPVSEIIRFIDSGNIQRVAVVDKSNRLVGLVSDRDILGVFAGHQAGIWDYFMSKIPIQDLAAKHQELIKQTKMKTAADVMKRDLFTVSENSRVDDAIKIMIEHGIKRLPVIDDNGVFKGMVSRDSVLRAGISST